MSSSGPAGAGGRIAAAGQSPLVWLGAGCGLTLAGLLGLLTLLLIAGSTGALGLVVGLVLATAPVPFYLALALWIDRFESEPSWMLVSAFVWGASGAAFIAFVLNTTSGALLAAVAGREAGAAVTGMISAPLVEETAKALALLVFFLWQRDEFDGVVDGVVYATMVGLGFAMVENVLYYGSAFHDDAATGAVALFVLRGMVSPFSHPLFTSMTGIGLGLAVQARSVFAKLFFPAAGLGVAVTLHFLWNTSATLGLAFLATYALVMMPTALGLLVLVGVSLKGEGRVVRERLAPDVASGLLTAADVAVLSSVRGRLLASFRTLTGSGGFRAWRRRAELHQVASELAFHRERVASGRRARDASAEVVEEEYRVRMAELRRVLEG